MRSAGNFNPEWGYLAPAPSLMRTLRVVLVATAVGATAGAAVVISLVDRPAASGDKIASTTAHAIVTSVQAAPAAAVPPAPVASRAAPVKLSAPKPVPAQAAAPQVVPPVATAVVPLPSAAASSTPPGNVALPQESSRIAARIAACGGAAKFRRRHRRCRAEVGKRHCGSLLRFAFRG